MSLTLQSIKYSWYAIAGISLAAASIYVADNMRGRIKQVDVIPIAIGTWEHCEATRISTNSWLVTPPTFTRSWVVTNAAGEFTTQTVTNTIGWRVDYDMLKECQEKIKELVPNYYHSDGNAYTITGVWDELDIGDGTNKWTQVPASGTNPAIYGDLTQTRIYTNTLIEMYKVLWIMSNTACNGSAQYRTKSGGSSYTNLNPDILTARTRAASTFSSNSVSTNSGFVIQRNAQEYIITNYFDGTNFISSYGCALVNSISDITVTNLSTNIISHRVMIYGMPNRVSVGNAYAEYYDQGLGYTESNQTLLASSGWINTDSVSFTNIGGAVESQPATGVVEPTDDSLTYFRGFQVPAASVAKLINWQFQYATNKFW